jgi:acetyltransferase-like isoleucine patch superfamily enzyme
VLALFNFSAAPGEMLGIQRARGWILWLIGVRIGRGSRLSEYLYIFDGRKIVIGEGCRIGSFCRIWDFCEIRIGNDLLASHSLTLISATHFKDAKRTNREGPITIGNNVWLGVNVTIVGPASIGDDVIVGANSLVLGNLEAGGVYVGSPARRVSSAQDSENFRISAFC